MDKEEIFERIKKLREGVEEQKKRNDEYYSTREQYYRDRIKTHDKKSDEAESSYDLLKYFLLWYADSESLHNVKELKTLWGGMFDLMSVISEIGISLNAFATSLKESKELSSDQMKKIHEKLTSFDESISKQDVELSKFLEKAEKDREKQSAEKEKQKDEEKKKLDELTGHVYG